MSCRVICSLLCVTAVFVFVVSAGERGSERGGDEGGNKKDLPPATVKEEAIFKLEGKLTKNDAKDRVFKESYSQVHKVNLEAGKTYQIELVSDEFDAVLRLEDDDNKRLAQEDDAGYRGTQIHILFQAKKAADYSVVATSFEKGQTGKYGLTIRALAEEQLAHFKEREAL